MDKASMSSKYDKRNCVLGSSFSRGWLVASSLGFGLLTVLSLHVAFADRADVAEGQTIFGTIDQNKFIPFTSMDFIFFALFSLVAFALFLLVSLWIDRNSKKQLRVIWSWRHSLCALALLLVAWLPYLFSWFPGGIFNDATVSIFQATGVNLLSNQQPILYTMLWSICIAVSAVLGHGLFASTVIMQALQVVAMAVAVLYGLYWLASHGASRWFCVASFAFFALFPFIPLYVISLWKETFFAIALFFFVLQYADAVILSVECDRSSQCESKPADCHRPESAHGNLVSCFSPVGFALSALGTAFLRNNGIYIVVASLCALLLLNRKQIGATFRKPLAPLLAAVTLSLVVQIGLFTALNLNRSSTVESLGIPLQQVARTYALGGSIPDEPASVFEQILPSEAWKSAYRPFIVDPIKWHSDFDTADLRENTLQFFVSYLETGFDNPRVYAEGFLLANCGFWDPWIGCNENVAHISLDMWGIDVRQFDLIQEWTGSSIRGILFPKIFPSAALFAWIVLFVGCTLLINVRPAVVLVPSLALWLTLLIATPIAYSLRYAFALVLLTPIIISFPAIMQRLIDSG